MIFDRGDSIDIFSTDHLKAAIATNLASEANIPIAISTAFKFVQDMVLSGDYFEWGQKQIQ